MGFTRAFYCWHMGQTSYSSPSQLPGLTVYSSSITDGTNNCKDTSGTLVHNAFYNRPEQYSGHEPFRNFSAVYSAYGSTNFIAGTGSTAESVDDYTMTSANVTVTCATSPSYGFDASNKMFIQTNPLTISNASSSSITIRELGAQYSGDTSYLTSQSAVGHARKSFLVWRKVIDPITIPAGGSVTLSVTIKMPIYQ